MGIALLTICVDCVLALVFSCDSHHCVYMCVNLFCLVVTIYSPSDLMYHVFALSFYCVLSSVCQQGSTCDVVFFALVCFLVTRYLSSCIEYCRHLMQDMWTALCGEKGDR